MCLGQALRTFDPSSRIQKVTVWLTRRLVRHYVIKLWTQNKNKSLAYKVVGFLSQAHLYIVYRHFGVFCYRLTIVIE